MNWELKGVARDTTTKPRRGDTLPHWVAVFVSANRAMVRHVAVYPETFATREEALAYVTANLDTLRKALP